MFQNTATFTFCLSTVIVLFAKQLLVLHQVELVTGVQLLVTENAHEAVHVVDVVLSPPHHGAGGDPLPTPGALGAVLPEEVLPAEDLVVLDEALLSERLSTDGAGETLGVPWLVHNLQDEPVQDHPTAGAALGDGGWNENSSCRHQERRSEFVNQREVSRIKTESEISRHTIYLSIISNLSKKSLKLADEVLPSIGLSVSVSGMRHCYGLSLPGSRDITCTAACESPVSEQPIFYF